MSACEEFHDFNPLPYGVLVRAELITLLAQRTKKANIAAADIRLQQPELIRIVSVARMEDGIAARAKNRVHIFVPAVIGGMHREARRIQRVELDVFFGGFVWRERTNKVVGPPPNSTSPTLARTN